MGLKKREYIFTSPPLFVLHVLFEAYAAESSFVVVVSPVVVSFSFASSFISGYTTIQGVYIKTPVFGDSANYQKMFQNSLGSILAEYETKTLDSIRDEILKSPGNISLNMITTTNTKVNQLFGAIRNAALNKLGGLAIKTYDSDIFNNWVKTDWIDGENGISKQITK